MTNTSPSNADKNLGNLLSQAVSQASQALPPSQLSHEQMQFSDDELIIMVDINFFTTPQQQYIDGRWVEQYNIMYEDYLSALSIRLMALLRQQFGELDLDDLRDLIIALESGKINGSNLFIVKGTPGKEYGDMIATVGELVRSRVNTVAADLHPAVATSRYFYALHYKILDLPLLSAVQKKIKEGHGAGLQPYSIFSIYVFLIADNLKKILQERLDKLHVE